MAGLQNSMMHTFYISVNLKLTQIHKHIRTIFFHCRKIWCDSLECKMDIEQHLIKVLTRWNSYLVSQYAMKIFQESIEWIEIYIAMNRQKAWCSHFVPLFIYFKRLSNHNKNVFSLLSNYWINCTFCQILVSA